MSLNLELLQRVRDAIADEGNAFDMGQWGIAVSARTWWPVDYDYERDTYTAGSCGTPACIAGWAIRLSIPKRKSRPTTTWREGVWSRAYELLGFLDVEDADALFYSTNWPEWTDALPKRAGALALLDALIAGEDPWSDDYVGAM